MTQFYSRSDVNYSGDVYSIPFNYIDKKEVKVYIDNELWTKWHFLNKHQLTLDEVPEDIRYSNIISVRRETDIEEKVVTYDNNSLLNKENLNKSQDQLLYAVQEIYDNNIQNNIDIRAEVDMKVERVSEAVEKLNTIDAAVETAVEAAEDASETLEEVVSLSDTLTDITEEVKSQVNYVNDNLTTIDEKLNNVTNTVLSHNMFDVVQKDHILTFEESKGLVAFGDYAYKTGSDSTRYGYPDFYERCIKEYNEAEDVTLYTTRNFSVDDTSTDLRLLNFKEHFYAGGGTATVRNFAKTRHIVGNDVITSLEINKPFVVNFTTGEDISTEQTIACFDKNFGGFLLRLEGGKIHFWGSVNGTSWGLTEKTGTSTLVVNTTYTVYVNWDGSTYTVDLVQQDETRTTEISIANTNPLVINAPIGLGANTYDNTLPFLGTINLIKDNEPVTYLTDKWYPYNHITIKQHSNKHAFYDIADVDAIDDIYARTRRAWFYGIDTENERIRIVRNDAYFMTGGADEVGSTLDAGIPNITAAWGTNGAQEARSSGAVYGKAGYSYGSGHESGSSSRFDLDVTRISNIYGNSDTVQTDAVKLMGYICVGNTESEVASTEVVEVTTTENDTLPLGFSDYFVVKPNHPSWLKSSYHFYTANMHETMYNWLVANKATNSSIKSIDETYTEYDFVVDEVNMKFRLPLKNGKESTYTTKVGYGEDISYLGEEITSYVNHSYVATTDGLITCTGFLREGGEFVLRIKENNGDLKYDIPFIYGESSEYITGSVPVKAGETYEIQAQNCLPYVTYTPIDTEVIINDVKADLYFKVANTVQNIELLNVGEVLEELSNKISTEDCKAYIIDAFEDGDSGYNLYSNGYYEEWGAFTYGSTLASGKSWTVDVSLLNNYKDTDYRIFLTYGYGTSSSTSAGQEYVYLNKTQSSFTASLYNRNSSTAMPATIQLNWETKGYINKGD